MQDNVTEPSKIMRLPFESLRGFEVVQDQFANLGVFFENAIVLQPSNTAYLPESGRMVLMGAPRNGWIEITFTVPINYFTCRLTSSHPATVTAYDSESHILKTMETETICMGNDDFVLDSPPANLPIEIQSANIQRLALNALDGQLVIYDVRFGF